MKNELAKFLESLNIYPNLYILGAGTSYGIVPTTSQLKSKIITHWLNIGGYTIINEKKNDTFSRVFGNENFSNSYLSSFYLNLLHNDALDWLISYYLSIESSNELPSNYEIFKYFPGKSIICNYNLDQYANYLKSKHIVLEPHGNIPIGLKSIFKDKNKFNEKFEFQLPIPWEEESIIIKPEKESILQNKEFMFLFNIWRCLSNIVIIGYSFSRFLNNIDDYISLNFFAEMIKYYKNNVYIIDPYPEYTQYLIEESIQKKICCLKLHWDKFTKILIKYLNKIGLFDLYKYTDIIYENYNKFDV